MAIITMDGHEITKLVLTPASGSPVTKNLVATNSFGSSDEGKVVSNGALKAQTSQSITENGTYDTTEKNSVVVNVQSSVTVDDWDIYGRQLVKTWGRELNLSDDTNFDSLTPSTSLSTIIANTESSETFDVDFANYRYMILRETFIKAGYTGTPANASFGKKVHIQAFFLQKTLNDTSVAIGVELQNMTYNYNSSGTAVAAPNGGAYGLYLTGNFDSPSFARTSGNETTVTIGTPRYAMRGSTSYAPVATLEAIDGSTSTIEYRFSVYRMPVNTLIGKAQSEAQYIVDNDGLRSSGS